MKRMLTYVVPDFFRRGRRCKEPKLPCSTTLRHRVLQAIIAIRLKHLEVSNRCAELRYDIIACLLQAGSYRGDCGLSGNEQDTLDDQARLYAISYLRDMYAVGGLLLLLTFLQLLSQRTDLKNMKAVKSAVHKGELITQRYECPPMLASAVASVLWASSLFPSELNDLKKTLCHLFGEDWCRRSGENLIPSAQIHARLYQLLYAKQVREPSEKECLLLIEEMYHEIDQCNDQEGVTERPRSDLVGTSKGIPKLVCYSSDPRIACLGSGSLCEPRAKLEALKISSNASSTTPGVVPSSTSPGGWPSSSAGGKVSPIVIDSVDSTQLGGVGVTTTSTPVTAGSTTISSGGGGAAAGGRVTHYANGLFVPAPSIQAPHSFSAADEAS